MTSTSLVPSILAPTNSDVVDGSAVEFSWYSEGKDDQFELAISTDAEFGNYDTLEVGYCHTLTLYDLLPADGTTYYWKVRSKNADSWSQPGTFVSGSDAQFFTRQQTFAEVEEVPEPHETPSEHLVADRVDGTTSAAAAIGFVAMMIGTFVLLLIVLRSVVG